MSVKPFQGICVCIKDYSLPMEQPKEGCNRLGSPSDHTGSAGFSYFDPFWAFGSYGFGNIIIIRNYTPQPIAPSGIA